MIGNTAHVGCFPTKTPSKPNNDNQPISIVYFDGL